MLIKDMRAGEEAERFMCSTLSCDAYAHIGGWYCGRERGHSGAHMAFDAEYGEDGTEEEPTAWILVCDPWGDPLEELVVGEDPGR